MKGWLDKYNDGGPVQPNYNDSNASAGPGFEGDGTFNKGRNYSPAWGGQFEEGGKLSFIDNPKLRNMLEGYQSGLMQPGDYRLPEGRMAGNINPSSEVSTSIGGEQGEPSYLIPSFKYGQPLQDSVQEFNMTGQHLGGPFKTWQDAEAYGELRHQYIDKGYKELPSPIATSNMAMGGSMPGSVGFMYARTNDPAPSEGKYAKKTLASAENGAEMQYYQEGLDWRPRSMADGGVVDTFLDPIINAGKSTINYFDNLVKTGIDKLSAMDTPTPVSVTPNKIPKKVPVIPKKDTYDSFRDVYDKSPVWDNLTSLYDKETYSKDKNRIKLNTGRFTGANVSSSLINDLAEAAKRNNIPVGQLLTLAGRESTFGEDGNWSRHGDSKEMYTSGWDVADQYFPYDERRFLADKKVPGISVVKDSHGWEYNINNEKAAREYVNKNPQLLDQYKKKLDSTPSPGNRNLFDLSAEFLKKKGIKGYNPGDPRYEEMFQKDYDTLKQDKALMSYLKKKGYTYEDGGQLTKLDQLTNFTNYNTKQPGGWLDKYQ